MQSSLERFASFKTVYSIVSYCGKDPNCSRCKLGILASITCIRAYLVIGVNCISLYLAVFKRAVKALLKHNRGKGYFMTCDAYT